MDQTASSIIHDARNSTFNIVHGNQYNEFGPDEFRTGLDAKIDKLAIADGASWNPAVTCLPGTRVAMIEEILQFICTPSKNNLARIFLLTGPAGSGKSAVAHTIAQRCHEMGLLACSFIFSRDYRDRPRRLFSTIARALAAHDTKFRQEIGLAIELDESLPTAPLPRQFQDLILAPTSKHPLGKPCIIVIDAFDECFDDQSSSPRELLKIFCDDISKLSARFCIVLTCREGHQISSLSRKTHVFTRTINTHEQANLDDIAMFVPAMLKEVADRHDLGSNWPEQTLVDDFTKRAEGLFLWVVTICRYLCDATYPEKKLRRFMSTRNPSSLSTMSRMDEIYSTILSTYDWDDEDFVEGYHLVLGAILAARAPLSLAALQSLYRAHPRSEISSIITRLGPLLTGTTESHSPVQILHLSLREFLVDRARSLPTTERFHINEAAHNERLALSCLTIMNSDVDPATPGLGYLAGPNLLEIPTIADGLVSEELDYACVFWMDHFMEIDTPGPGIADAMRTFLSNLFIPWVEIVGARGKYKRLAKLRKKLQIYDSELFRLLHTASHAAALHRISLCVHSVARLEEALDANYDAVELYRHLADDRPDVFIPDVADSLNSLSIHLSSLGHREGALDAIREAVELRRRLVASQPAVFDPALANSLKGLSDYLSKLGHREDALDTIKEAVEMYRRLAGDCPAEYNPDLANALNSLSACLSNLDHREDALDAIQEAIQLYQHLAADRPAEFNPDLANSLNNLSIHLSSLGHRDDALKAIREAVQLYQHLAADRPAVFTPNLANSLGVLSYCLSDVGRLKDALGPIREAVDSRRQLAAYRPAVFNPDLAKSLHSLSDRLLNLGHGEDALKAIREAVELRRRLAADRPPVFNPDLAVSLNYLSIQLFDQGHRDEALVAIQEAIELRRYLAADRPVVFNADLATSLSVLCYHLSVLGPPQGALDAIREAIKLYRDLAADRPAIFNPNLAKSLHSLSHCLYSLGYQEALDAIREAIILFRPLANDNLATFGCQLAAALRSLSLILEKHGFAEDAAGASAEAALIEHGPSQELVG